MLGMGGDKGFCPYPDGDYYFYILKKLVEAVQKIRTKGKKNQLGEYVKMSPFPPKCEFENGIFS
jgi:hypothetical protein